MKNFLKFLIVVMLVISIQACDEKPIDNNVSTTGTIKFIQLEGGFWGIIGKNQKYDPVNLPEAFKIEGLKVQFTAKLHEDMVSIHMWGTLVSIIKMKSLNKKVNLIMDIGVVQQKFIQGNPWLIETETETFQILNLPDHFRFDGYEVSFVGKIREDVALIPALWRLVEAFSIKKTSELSITVNLGEEFNLPVGGSANLNESNFVLTFNEVLQDSRCPSGVQCVWMGEGVIKINVKIGDVDYGNFKLSTFNTPEKPASFFLEGYKIEYVTLLPYPIEGNNVLNKNKVASFKIFRVEK